VSEAISWTDKYLLPRLEDANMMEAHLYHLISLFSAVFGFRSSFLISGMPMPPLPIIKDWTVILPMISSFYVLSIFLVFLILCLREILWMWLILFVI